MPNTDRQFQETVFAKTASGHDEVKTRALGLPPLVRRLLILVDGKRTVQELAPLVSGQAVSDLLQALVERQCIERVATAPTTSTPIRREADKSAAIVMPDAALAALPPAESRSAKDLQMARNFMTNTVNAEFGQHMRLSLIKAVGESTTAAELRLIYPLWLSTMAASQSAAKQLPALTNKLFRVL